MSCIWVLAAESSRAKLYSAENRKAPLLEIGDFVHPESRLHEGDLVSGQSGSDGGSVGQGRHVLDNKTNARDAERAEFAGMLADRLEAARKEDVFNRVVLIAPPAFLGLLRDNLSDGVKELVTEQIDKNLVQQPADVVRKHLSWPE
ncbi:MAG: host attachment protein [Pseudomonadales bacterium]|jgi:protein required for attachment to host cells|nr:host attachment protein [Pseudomonadales bacterium]